MTNRILAGFALAVLLASLPSAASELPPPLTASDFRAIDESRAALGRLLFYDPVLSGNRNISCGTCHNHDHASADGLSLGIGQGGKGIGPKRTAPDGPLRISRRVPRNAPALFNLGAKDIRVLFHDGRLSEDGIYGNRFNSPAEEYLPKGLASITAAQALLPVTSEVEMAGHPEENEIAGARNDRIDHVWRILEKRLRAIPAYEEPFRAAFPDIERSADITIVHAANAIGDFIDSEWRSFDSPFDVYLRGDPKALTAEQKRGMEVFFGAGRCSECHSGKLLSDQNFHALALPQFGPGRTRPFDPIARDVGRMGETDRIEDAYRFRTPMLRNVERTGPYGHNGAYATLEGIVRHHLQPLAKLSQWRVETANLPDVPWLRESDFAVLADRAEQARLRSRVDIEPVGLGDEDVSALVAFLKSLTGRSSIKGRLGKPSRVPSGLPVD